MAPGGGQLGDDIGDLGFLLPDSDINTFHVLPFLVDDRVNRQSGLAQLAVADDEFALAAADRNHGVNRFDAGLNRLFDGFAGNDARGDLFHRIKLIRFNLAFAVQRLAQRIRDAAE